VARRQGDRNRDFDEKRRAILSALAPRLLEADGPRISLNEMAACAGVSASSLRHHLGDRAEVWAAVIDLHGQQGLPYLSAVRAPTDLPLETSLRTTMAAIAFGLERGLATILANGMAAGVQDPTIGLSYLNHLLEPVLQAMEARLTHHLGRGELGPCDVRLATLGLLSPLVLGALHQRSLGGCDLRPMSLPDLAQEQVSRFLLAYAATNAPPDSERR
jgi:AcrR family transcriptional regulator